MTHAYQIHKQDAAYFLTLTAVEWDAFMRREHKQILCDSLNYCVNVKGLEIFAYVIMSSHMHMIARAKESNLSEIIRDFKKFTSAMLIKDFRTSTESRSGWMLDLFKAGGKKQKKKSSMQLWQYNNHAMEVFSPKFTLSKILYIHNNPVEAGLVRRAEDYLFSSAQDYSGQKGPVEVSVINLHSLF
ncbi:MAG: transposase [Bacteroidetes bacterium]|nr:transposase [Bacteroidota bacterium]